MFSKIEKKSAKAALAVNEDKAKLMVSTSRASTQLKQSMHVDKRYYFEIVDEFMYLGSAVKKNNNFILETKWRIVLANTFYFGLIKHFRDKAFFRETKIQLYKNLIQPVLLYGAEYWVLSQADDISLEGFERKMLRKYIWTNSVQRRVRQWMNHELYELYLKLVSEGWIKTIQLERLQESIVTKAILSSRIPEIA